MSTRPDPGPRTSPRRIARVLVSFGVVAATFFFVIPRIADFSAVWAQIQRMQWWEIALLVLIGTWNLITYAFVLAAAAPGLTVPQAVVVTESSTAVANAVPGGGALGVGVTFAMFRSWGFSASETTLAVVISGIWNNLIKLGLPVLALALLALEGGPSASRVALAVVGVGVLGAAVLAGALALRKETVARRIGDVTGRATSGLRQLVRRAPVSGWGDAACRFRGSALPLLRRSWRRLTATVVVSQLSLAAVLVLTLRSVGVSEAEVGTVEVIAAFAFVRLLSALPLTPGGLGVVELGLTAALVGAGGDRAKVLAAVLVFRALTYLAPVAVGLVTYVIWSRKTSWRGAAPALST